jgi:hypothetical protein
MILINISGQVVNTELFKKHTLFYGYRSYSGSRFFWSWRIWCSWPFSIIWLTREIMYPFILLHTKVGVLRASHKIFLSLTGKFEWKFSRFHLCTAQTFHANSPVRLKKKLVQWDSRTTATLVTVVKYNCCQW